MKAFTIGRAARAAGVSVETIRFYERKGLIPQPPRPRAGGPRDYGGDTVARLRFIREAQDIGFSLAEAGELLRLQADGSAGCADVRQRALAKRHEVRAKLERLERIGDALDALIARCPGTGGLSDCTILGALQSERAGPEAGAEASQ